MPRPGRTKQECIEKAQEYTTLKDFCKNAKKYYTYAYRRGWLQEVCAHLQREWNLHTKEEVSIAASKYKYRSDFYKGDPILYDYAYEHKWLDEVCAHMVLKGSGKGTSHRTIYWFQFNDHSVYVGLTNNPTISARRYKDHMTSTASQVYKKIMDGYSFIYEFDGYFYPESIASNKEQEKVEEFRQNGWIILNKARAGGLGNVFRYTDEELEYVAKQYSILSEFMKEHPSMYSIILRRKRQDMLAHMYRGKGYEYFVKGKNTKHTKEKCAEVALLCSTISEFQEKYPKEYAAAYSRKWIKEICSHMLSREERMKQKYTKENCFLEAKKYNTRTEFSKKAQGYYRYALNNGWIDELCSHMLDMHAIVSDIRGRSKEECAKEAQKYTTRREFQVSAKSYYNRASKNGWLDDICFHMVK